MNAAAATSSPTKEMEGRHVEQPHVLVVDDCRITRKSIKQMFKKRSCKVTTAESGMEALEFLGLAENSEKDINVPKVDMVITDYSMPEMNGYELLMKIKESWSAVKNVPVVIVSSEPDPALIGRCVGGGALKFISKPLKLSDVDTLMTLMLK